MPERKEKWEKRLEKVKKKNKKDLDEKLKRSYDLFDLEDTEEMKIIHELRRRKFILDRLVLDKHGIVGYIIPILLTIGLFILGIIAGIFSKEIEFAAQLDYIYWILFILIGTYLLNWLVWAIMEAAKEYNLRLDISKETHDRILSIIFGKFGITMSLLIALPFMIYDFNGFGLTEEGWLNGIALYYKNEDDSWYPHISQTENGIGFGSILWLVIWLIPWIYFGAFLWLSTAFLFYMNIMLKRETWRDRLSKVLYERQYKHLLNLSVGVYIPLVPYIILKMIFQIFFIPWWSDTIGTFLLFGVFILGILFSPFIVTTDIKKRKKELLIKLHNYGYLFFEEVAKDLFLGKIRSSEDIGKAIIMHLYNDDMYEELSKKVIDSSLIKTIMFAVIGPIASYAAKIIISGNFIF